MRAIGFSYEGSVHCPACAVERFGNTILDDSSGLADREGNEPRAIFAITEWYEPSAPEPQALMCDDCSEIIACAAGQPEQDLQVDYDREPDPPDLAIVSPDEFTYWQC